MPESSDEQYLNYPMNLIDGFISWLKTSLENGDEELRQWVDSPAFITWCEMWNGLELPAERVQTLLLECWHEGTYAPHQGPRRYVRRD